jgi:hypothetical protein
VCCIKCVDNAFIFSLLQALVEECLQCLEHLSISAAPTMDTVTASQLQDPAWQERLAASLSFTSVPHDGMSNESRGAMGVETMTHALCCAADAHLHWCRTAGTAPLALLPLPPITPTHRRSADYRQRPADGGSAPPSGLLVSTELADALQRQEDEEERTTQGGSAMPAVRAMLTAVLVHSGGGGALAGGRGPAPVEVFIQAVVGMVKAVQLRMGAEGVHQVSGSGYKHDLAGLVPLAACFLITELKLQQLTLSRHLVTLYYYFAYELD